MTKSTKKTKTKKLKQGYFFIALGVVAMAVLVVGAFTFVNRANEEARKDRIVAIYDSLKLTDEFKLESENIFGDKRVYEWDSSRTKSSSRTYVLGANVGMTVTAIKQLIENAGFKYFDEPYPGSWIHQYHFKSDKNEYIRLSVYSKPKWDASRYDAIMHRSEPSQAFYDANPDIGPAEIIIKVNLDDNNE